MNKIEAKKFERLCFWILAELEAYPELFSDDTSEIVSSHFEECHKLLNSMYLKLFR